MKKGSSKSTEILQFQSLTSIKRKGKGIGKKKKALTVRFRLRMANAILFMFKKTFAVHYESTFEITNGIK